MDFRSTLKLNPSSHKIKYADSLFFIGSCFSNNISKILKKRKFNTTTNPFGILYNPISVFDNLENILSQKNYAEKDLFLKDEIWNCFEFHSDMSGIDKHFVLENINKTIETSYASLKKANIIFITFGTAWVYEKEGEIVANCYKINAKNFNKRLLSIDEIYTKANNIIKLLKKQNKNLKIVFTVSPVRHLKDGFVENNQSKATLFLAIKKICKNATDTSYFPAYELIMDDLRDYRFFKEDMVHPNKLAIDYILEKFDAHYFEQDTKNMINKIEKINSSLAHKVRFKNTVSYSKFKDSLIKKIIAIEELGFDFTKEKESFL